MKVDVEGEVRGEDGGPTDVTMVVEKTTVVVVSGAADGVSVVTYVEDAEGELETGEDIKGKLVE